jgi:hypothetical protein
LHDSPLASAEHDLEADVPTLLVENRTSNVTESVHHITGVQESHCDIQQWHIRRMPSVGKKVCFAMQTVIGRKCIQKLPLSIHALTYFRFLHVQSKNKDFEQLFYFCPDNIARCVKGTRCKWIKSRPDVPDVWPVQRGTNLNARDIMTLEQAGFQLQQRQHTAQERFFDNNEAVVAQIRNIPEPVDPQMYLIHSNGITTRHNLNRVIFVAQLSRWEASTIFDAEISNVTLVPSPRIGAVIDLVSKHGNEAKEYKVSIGPFLECPCIDFQHMVIKFKKRGQYYNCKHLYYLYLYCLWHATR